MSDLRDALEEYLSLRRALGYQLRDTAIVLRQFVAFLDEQGTPFITTKLALRWAKLPTNAQPAWIARRLGMVSIFAKHRSATDNRTEIPPRGLLMAKAPRKRPYIYSDEEIKSLIKAADGLPSATGLRSLTYTTLFGLLAVTGMRISEAIALDREDVDMINGVITIRRTKFGKTRLVPIHSSTRDVLKHYAQARDRILPKSRPSAFLVSERGTRMTGCTVRWTFVRLSRRIGLRSPSKSHGHGPRLHDFRHRFAVTTLLTWYRAGVDVERNIPKLATYLGHAHVNDTYWYLSATPELLELAAKRLSQRPGGLSS